MRLEHDDEPPVWPRRDRRRQLGRVVAVVVDERHAPGRRRDRAVHLQPALDAGELPERALQRRIGDLELRCHRDGRERVEHVVEPREIELDRERLAPLLPGNLETRAETQRLDVVRAKIGALAKTIARDAAAELRNQLARVVVVAAKNASP